MRIAIVDDLASDRRSLCERLDIEMKERSLSAEIIQFESGDSFLAKFEAGKFDAVFLDVYMDGADGIEVARRIYRDDPKCKIVFLTTSEEFFRESYEVRATYYLIKPFENERLSQALDFCFPKPKSADILNVKTRESIINVLRGDILFIEAHGRYPHIHTVDKTLECRCSFSEVTSPLENDERFFMSCRGVLVNIEQVKQMEDSDFIMKNGERVPISQRNRQQARKAFFDAVFKM